MSKFNYRKCSNIECKSSLEDNFGINVRYKLDPTGYAIAKIYLCKMCLQKALALSKNGCDSEFPNKIADIEERLLSLEGETVYQFNALSKFLEKFDKRLNALEANLEI